MNGIDPHDAIFIFTEKGMLPPVTESLDHIATKYASDDGFLYLIVTKENAFGFK